MCPEVMHALRVENYKITETNDNENPIKFQYWE